MTGIILSENGANSKSYLKDSHGNVTSIYNGSQLENTYQYSAFGNEITGNAFEQNPFGYCGEYTDNETGLVYLRNRYYSAATGRFLTEDPIRSGLNWYVYCGNNPIMFVDSIGLKRVVLRETIESLGGVVSWDSLSKTAIVSLDNQSAVFYDGDSNGTNNLNGKLYVDDKNLFSVLAVIYDLGKGWTGRIERATYGDYDSKHVHVYKNKKSYSQNDDGSPHDGSTGSPPKKIKQSLKEKTGWDWDKKENSWIDKIEILPAIGSTVVKYPNFVSVEVCGYNALFGPEALKSYYSASRAKFGYENGVFVLPSLATGISVNVISPYYIPVYP